MYRSGCDRFLKFCLQASLTPFPVTENTLLLFVGHLHQARLAHGTMKSYLAAVRYEQIRSGMGDPAIHSMPQLEYVLKGAKKATPESSRRRLPITPRILLALKQVWHKLPSGRDAQMLWAAACLCFSGFLRSGEATCPSESEFDPDSHLAFSDVAVDNRDRPTALQVTLKASKTDPYRRGVTLHIGVAGGPLCPVAAVLNYMVARGCSEGPLFIWEDGKFLTRESFVTSMRAALTQAGFVAKDYAGHSFRVGAATTAAQRGVQDSLLKTLGRWKSSAYTRYIRTPPEVLRGVAKILCAVDSE